MADAVTRSTLERRRNDDVFPERGAPHLGHVEHVLGILNRDSPRIGLDGVSELRLVAEPALGEAVEADLGLAGFAIFPDRTDDVVLDVAIDVQLFEDRTVDAAPVLQSQSMSNTLGPSSTIRCHAGVVIACWKSARSFHHAHEYPSNSVSSSATPDTAGSGP